MIEADHDHSHPCTDELSRYAVVDGAHQWLLCPPLKSAGTASLTLGYAAFVCGCGRIRRGWWLCAF